MRRPPRLVLHVMPPSLATPSCLQMYWLDPASYGLWGLATSQLGDITHVSIAVQPGMVGAVHACLRQGGLVNGIARRGRHTRANARPARSALLPTSLTANHNRGRVH